LALTHKSAQHAQIVLLEEPESHLSFSKLNQLIKAIEEKYEDKQIIISTHSSFVANKLGLENLLLLENHQVIRVTELASADFFKKISGYDTLRLIMCKKAILVEGDSDELVVQKAYKNNNNNHIPNPEENWGVFKDIQYFSCSNYKVDTKGTCETRHYIRADAIEQVVMLELKRMVSFLQSDEEAFAALLAQKTQKDIINEQKALQGVLQRCAVRNQKVAELYEKRFYNKCWGDIKITSTFIIEP